MSKGNPFRILFISAFCLLSRQSAAIAHQAQEQTSRFMQVPVLYMTDRAFSGDSYLNQRRLEDDSIYNIYCGKLNYIVENNEHKALTDERKLAGWVGIDKPPKSLLIQKPLADSGGNTAYKSFSEQIIETAKKTNSQELFIYIHGFNNPFAGAASSAAKLAYYVERPVILYSWPSTGKILQYSVDSGNNEWSQEHYNRFLEELITIKQKTGLRFNLVAHSMGNRLAIRAAPITKGTYLFKHVFLVDPDFDAETFVHYVARFAVTHVSTSIPEAISEQEKFNSERFIPGKLRILFSRRDNALPIVQLMSGGYTRLGQGADTMLESLFNPKTLPNAIQDTATLFQTNRPQAIEGMPNIELYNKQEKEIIKAFEWIDYTVLDHGILGHSMPFKLIADLWSAGRPNDTLELVADSDDNVNRFTNIASSLFHQRQRVASFGACQKIIFKEPLSNKKKIKAISANN